MANLAGIPVELLIHIFSLLDRPALGNIRLTSRWLATLATDSFFETLYLFPTYRSQRKAGYILQDSALENCVRRVYIMTYKEEWVPDAVDKSDSIEPLPIIQRQITTAYRFPRLKHIALCFDRHYIREGERYRYFSHVPPQGQRFREIVLQWLFLFSRTAKRQPDGLTIQNIQELTPSLVPYLEKILQQGLKALRLYIVHEPSDQLDALTYSESVMEKLPSTMLNPTASKLEHLALYSDKWFGHKPALDLSEIHFPRLKSLALGQYAFFHDFQLDWILSHGPTLRELYLDSCSILSMICSREVDMRNLHQYLRGGDGWEEVSTFDSGVPEWCYRYRTRWHNYFTSFHDGLPHLRHFRIGKGEWEKIPWAVVVPFERERDIKIGLFESRYSIYRHGYLDTEAVSPAKDKKDMEALWRLFVKIGQTVGKRELAERDLLEDEIID